MNINKGELFHYTGSGLDNIYLKSGFEIHETPYGEGFSIMDVENLHKVIGLDIINHVAELNGSQVRFFRKELDLSQKSLADLMDISEDTIRNWETGRTKINKVADAFLRQYYTEYVEGDGSLREIVDRITKLDRAEYHVQLEFRDAEKQWHTAAAA